MTWRIEILYAKNKKREIRVDPSREEAYVEADDDNFHLPLEAFPYNFSLSPADRRVCEASSEYKETDTLGGRIAKFSHSS